MKSPGTNFFSNAFWTRFSKLYWEKKPLLIKQIHSPLMDLDQTEIFNLLIQFADRCRKKKDPTGFKFFMEGQRLHDQEALELLPRKTDRSLSGYHARMSAEFSDYCLVCDELLQVSHQHQALLQEFTDGLYRQVGFPNRFAEMGLYLGNYRRTPFGVHVDGCGVFSFPVVGTKKFRLWSSSFGKKNPQLDRAFEYRKFNKSSQLLTAHPGDMTYWPSSAWHIAESDGEFSATWSLGVWVDRPHHEMIAEALSALLIKTLGADAKKVTTPLESRSNQKGRAQLPPLYRRSLRALSKVKKTDLHKALLKHWTDHVSKKGLKPL